MTQYLVAIHHPDDYDPSVTGDEVMLRDVVIRRAKPQYTLEELLKGMKPDMAHAEVDFGESVGNERF